MSTTPRIFEWIEKYGIKRLLNTPCAGSDCEEFESHGLTVLGVNILPPILRHIQADLNTWTPDGKWDAAYINCLFCNVAEGSKAAIVKNIASWPIKYVLIFDTVNANPPHQFDWHPAFEEAGWKIIEKEMADSYSLIEVWRRA